MCTSRAAGGTAGGYAFEDAPDARSRRLAPVLAAEAMDLTCRIRPAWSTVAEARRGRKRPRERCRASGCGTGYPMPGTRSFRSSVKLRKRIDAGMADTGEGASAGRDRGRYNRTAASIRLTADGIMDRTSSNVIDESALTKGQLSKLNSLRKSVGEEVGERAFAAWLAAQGGADEQADGNATTIVDALWPLVEQGTLAIPRGGYLLRRGRGRIIVESARR